GQDLYRATQSYQWIDGDYLTAQYLQHIDLQDPSAISLGRWVSMPLSTLLSAESSDETTFLYTLSYNRYQDEQDVWQYETILQAHAFDGAGIFPLHSIKTPWVVACEPGVFLAVGQDGENSQITVVEYAFNEGFSVAS